MTASRCWARKSTRTHPTSANAPTSTSATTRTPVTSGRSGWSRCRARRAHDEKKVLPKEELNNPELWPPEPKYAQGDLVEVEGTWATKSPKGFVKSDGLLIYKNMTVVTPAVPEPEKPGAAPAPAAPTKPTKAKPGHKGR
jgi:hypothetical protein